MRRREIDTIFVGIVVGCLVFVACAIYAAWRIYVSFAGVGMPFQVDGKVVGTVDAMLVSLLIVVLAVASAGLIVLKTVRAYRSIKWKEEDGSRGSGSENN